MSEEVQAKIFSFLTSVMTLRNEQTCMRLELFYSPSGGYRNDSLRSWVRESEADAPAFEAGKVFLERLTADVVELAEGYADSYGMGKHRFVLRATLHLNGRRSFPFVMLPSGDAAGANGEASGDESTALATVHGVPGSAPTQTGIIAQLMRHVEVKERATQAMMQTMMSAVSHHAKQQHEENTDLRAENAQLRKERVEYQAQIEAARSVEHQQQIEAMAITAKEERRTMATKKLLSLAPVAISQWMNIKSKGAVGDMTPQAPTPLAIAAGELFGSLAGDQRGRLEGLLSIEGRIMLSEVVRVVTAGGSPLLPTLVSDLIRSFDQRQLAGLLAIFSVEQQALFVKVMQLATAATAGEPTATAATPTPTNGEQHEIAEQGVS